MIQRESTVLLLTEKIFFLAKRGTESVPAPTNLIFELDINDDPMTIGATTRQAHCLIFLTMLGIRMRIERKLMNHFLHE